MVATARGKASRQKDADIAAIRKLSESFQAAVNGKKVDQILNLVTDDVVLVPPEGMPVVGKLAVEESYQRLFSGFDLKQLIEIEDVYITGDRAFIWGTTSITITPRGGQQKQTRGTGMTIAQRQRDGSWKISHGINNMVG